MVNKQRQNSIQYRLKQLEKIDTANMTVVDICHSIGGAPEGSLRAMMKRHGIPFKVKSRNMSGKSGK